MYTCDEGGEASIEGGLQSSGALNLPSISPAAFLREVHIDCEYVPFPAQDLLAANTLGLLGSEDTKLYACQYPAYADLDDYAFEDVESLNDAEFPWMLDEPASGRNQHPESNLYSGQAHERDQHHITLPYESEEYGRVNADTTDTTVALEMLHQTIAQIFLGNLETEKESRTYQMTSLMEVAPMVFCPGFATVGIYLSLRSSTL